MLNGVRHFGFWGGLSEHGVPMVKFPDGPGVGIEVDESAVTNHLIAEPITLRKDA